MVSERQCTVVTRWPFTISPSSLLHSPDIALNACHHSLPVRAPVVSPFLHRAGAHTTLTCSRARQGGSPRCRQGHARAAEAAWCSARHPSRRHACGAILCRIWRPVWRRHPWALGWPAGRLQPQIRCHGPGAFQAAEPQLCGCAAVGQACSCSCGCPPCSCYPAGRRPCRGSRGEEALTHASSCQ